MDPQRRVKVSPDFASYAEKHEIFQTFEEILKQVVMERPEDPLPFIRDLLTKHQGNFDCFTPTIRSISNRVLL